VESILLGSEMCRQINKITLSKSRSGHKLMLVSRKGLETVGINVTELTVRTVTCLSGDDTTNAAISSEYKIVLAKVYSSST
jgi:hypothetical protein